MHCSQQSNLQPSSLTTLNSTRTNNEHSVISEGAHLKANALDLTMHKSKINDINVDSLIMEELENSFNAGDKSKLGKINKSKSLITLASKNLKPIKTPQQILQKRFKQSKQEVQNQIAGLEKQCDKFGGHIYIRNQMNKQQITAQELYNFYKQRITSIHGSLTLPKLATRHPHPNHSSKQIKSLNSSPSSSQFKYNKWYIQPNKRFTVLELNHSQNIKRVTQYIDKILKDNRDKVSIRQQYAPVLVKQSARRLGRNPVVCSYAEIKRR